MIFHANSSPFKFPVILHYMHVLKLIYAHSDVLSFKIRSKLEIYVRSAGHEATESVVALDFETIMDTSFTGILFL